jgi:16S rRNA (guanine1207-N2)-methyltransferase
MVADAGRALRPGAELWLVVNSHLPYLPVARQHVGPTPVAVRTSRTSVTCSTKR